MTNYADTFLGKLYLLIIDKIVIGAIIAAAFFIYDQYKTIEARNIQNSREAIQLEFEKSKLIKEFLPVIQDKKIDLVTRGYVLPSAVLTGSIDADVAFELGQEFLRLGLADNHYKRIIAATLPESIPSISERGNLIADEWYSKIGAFPDLNTIFDPVSGRENLPSQYTGLVTEARSIRDTLYSNLSIFEGCKCPELSSENKIPQYLFGLFTLFQPKNIDQAVRLSQSDQKALKLLGMVFRLWKRNGEDSEARKYITDIIKNAKNSEAALRQSEVLIAMIKWISAKEKGFASNAFSRILADIATGRLMSGSLYTQEEADLYWLRWNAAEAIFLMGDNGTEAQPIISNYLGIFYEQLLIANSEENLASVSGKFQSGKIIRVLIDSMGKNMSPENAKVLHSLYSLDEHKLRHFPFLKSDIERVLKTNGD